MPQPGGYALGNQIIKSGKSQCRRDDKKTEKQEYGGSVDVADNVGGGNAAKNHHANSAQGGPSEPFSSLLLFSSSAISLHVVVQFRQIRSSVL
jgi:hypothetical protein